ncbi:dTMP kinase [Candidatus Bathyarchaeota archaeon A05DMB-2]|jgi:dTMP kinase|nr:dTMP kinase [Candidatus Bathyarchaeota archaeon A05DMB-2]
MDRKGVFICIEGLDGCGKTTQAKLLAGKLQKSHSAIYTAEPSRGSIGTFIRKSILYREKRLPSVVEALLFAADRVEHVQNEVLPALRQGKLVISDRYVYSSLAYQGAAGLSLEWIQKINEHALRPDLAIFIDVNPETVMQRLKANRSVMENLETQRKVREIYLQFVEKGDLIRIDGNKPKNAVAQALHTAVLKFLNANH